MDGKLKILSVDKTQGLDGVNFDFEMN